MSKEMSPAEAFFFAYLPTAEQAARRVVKALRRLGFDVPDAEQEAAARLWRLALCDRRRTRAAACDDPHRWVGWVVRRRLLRLLRRPKPLFMPIEQTVALTLAGPDGEDLLADVFRSAPPDVGEFLRLAILGRTRESSGLNQRRWDAERVRATRWLDAYLNGGRR